MQPNQQKNKKNKQKAQIYINTRNTRNIQIQNTKTNQKYKNAKYKCIHIYTI